MKSPYIARIFLGLLTSVVFCIFAAADTRGQAPEFAALTSDKVGELEEVVRPNFEVTPSSYCVAPRDGLIAQLEAYSALAAKGGSANGAQNSPAIADALRRALSQVGQSMHSNTQQANGKNSIAAPGNGAKVIDVPRKDLAVPPKPSPKTVFVFTNGERLEADHYTIDANSLHIADVGQQRTVALSTLDIKTTLAVDRERGIELKIPQSRSEITIAF